LITLLKRHYDKIGDHCIEKYELLLIPEISTIMFKPAIR